MNINPITETTTDSNVTQINCTKQDANRIIYKLLDEVVSRNRSTAILNKSKPSNLVTIVDGEVGIGKSFTLKKYIQNNQDCKALVFLESIDGVHKYAEELQV